MECFIGGKKIRLSLNFVEDKTFTGEIILYIVTATAAAAAAAAATAMQFCLVRLNC